VKQTDIENVKVTGETDKNVRETDNEASFSFDKDKNKNHEQTDDRCGRRDKRSYLK